MRKKANPVIFPSHSRGVQREELLGSCPGDASFRLLRKPECHGHLVSWCDARAPSASCASCHCLISQSANIAGWEGFTGLPLWIWHSKCT